MGKEPSELVVWVAAAAVGALICYLNWDTLLRFLGPDRPDLPWWVWAAVGALFVGGAAGNILMWVRSRRSDHP